jgi:hypothetical protein
MTTRFAGIITGAECSAMLFSMGRPGGVHVDWTLENSNRPDKFSSAELYHQFFMNNFGVQPSVF